MINFKTQRLDPLVQGVKDFLSKRNVHGKKLLLGFSGGPDSQALLHLLLECKDVLGFELHVAHIDHGWRPESAEEAQGLCEKVEALGLPFHLKTLEAPQEQRNLEDQGRQARLAFFQELCRRESCEALLLAHHADDQAETVLKRVLEGARLPMLSGISPASDYEGMSIWRPLLVVCKKDVEVWLAERGIASLNDQTNSDPKFLRARMRQEILPCLSDAFGKEVRSGLVKVGSDAQELRAYLDARVAPYLTEVSERPFGAMLDLSQRIPDHPFELCYLIQKFCSKQGLQLPQHLAKELCKQLAAGAANKQVQYCKRTCFVDRGKLFVLNTNLPQLPSDAVNLSEGRHQYGPWHVEVEVLPSAVGETVTGWQDVWKGSFTVCLPAAQYTLFMPKGSAHYPGTHSI